MSSPKKTKCSNCDKEIDSNKFFLHERFCEINVRKCSICKEPVQKDEYEEHKSVEHADPICAFCHKAFPNTEYDSHIKNCSKKLYECQYCGLFMNQNELKDHEYQCGSKTIKCEYCGENITKKLLMIYIWNILVKNLKKIIIRMIQIIVIILMKILIKLLIKIKKKKM